MPGEVLQEPNRYISVRGRVPVEECPNCRRTTVLSVNNERAIWPRITSNMAPPLGRYVVERALTCMFCDHTTIEFDLYGASDTQMREPESTTTVWPRRAPRELPPEAPPTIASFYREASVAEFAGATRGAAGLYRATVEEVVKLRGMAGRDLRDRIEALRGAGVADDPIDDLHEARLLGNWSLHDAIEFAPEEVADVASLIADATYELYVDPANRERLRAARASRRRRE